MSETMLECAALAAMKNGSPDPVERVFFSEISAAEILDDFIFGAGIMTADHHSPLSFDIDKFPNKDALVAHVHFQVASSQEVTKSVQTHLVEL